MEKEAFIQKLFAMAKEAEIEACEVYTVTGDSFRAMTAKGEITNYTVNRRSGLSLRGLYNGHMGYASTEAMDDEAIGQLVRSVLESAQLTEDDAVQEIYKGDAEYAKVDNYAPQLDAVPESEKLEFVLEMEKQALRIDPRIAQVSYNMLVTESAETRIVNSYGLNLIHCDNYAIGVLQAVAREGERVATGIGYALGRDFSQFNAEKVGREAADEALFMLKAASVKSGSYHTIIHCRCMPDLLSVFDGLFSAENAQQGLSLLKGREGEVIASQAVTLMDDPHLKGGVASCPFDAEGVATRTKAVIENGVLTTLLHNLKTARKAGVKTTGNAGKAGYAAPVRVSPSNFYFKPGEKDLSQLCADMGDGLVITDMEGLHAGANPVSGDFSLSAKGYTVKDGKKDLPVEQITIAGNFYTLLKNIRAFGNDLLFPGGNVGSPSVDIGEIAVAGN